MNTKKQKLLARKHRIRSKISGSAARPRVVIYRSNKALYAQIVNDETHTTIASATVSGKTVAKAKELGGTIADYAKKKNIKTIVFDRGGNKYHGVIKTFVDTLREGGITV
jgi:large subunit ribosomal protein L18